MPPVLRVIMTIKIIFNYWLYSLLLKGISGCFFSPNGYIEGKKSFFALRNYLGTIYFSFLLNRGYFFNFTESLFLKELLHSMLLKNVSCQGGEQDVST